MRTWPCAARSTPNPHPDPHPHLPPPAQALPRLPTRPRAARGRRRPPHALSGHAAPGKPRAPLPQPPAELQSGTRRPAPRPFDRAADWAARPAGGRADRAYSPAGVRPPGSAAARGATRSSYWKCCRRADASAAISARVRTRRSASRSSRSPGLPGSCFRHSGQHREAGRLK